MSDALGAAARQLRERVGGDPAVGLILGSGLGAIADDMRDAVRVPYAELPGFARPTVEGHAGTLVAGKLEGVHCIVLQGRFHLYEGHDADTVAFPVRLLVRHGLRALIVTCAAGGVRPSLRAGDIMLIDDHVNLMWRNPLAGPVRPGEERFPDFSRPYDPVLQDRAARIALDLGLAVTRGVYCAVPGPSYETPAEVRMLQRLGVDAVGMSTVPEVLVAHAGGVPVLGTAVITNRAAGLTPSPLSHEEVIRTGEAAAASLTLLVRGVVRTFRPYASPAGGAPAK